VKRFGRLLSGPVGAIVIAIVLASIAMAIAGVNPIDGFAALIGGSLGGPSQIGETLVQTTALLFPALGVTLAFRAGLFNIGAEGQLVVGGLFAGAIGARYVGPTPIAILIILGAGITGGALWGAIAGWLRARFNANEIISTLMLNFVAASLANYLVGGPLRVSTASGAETGPLPQSSWLPLLLPNSRLTIALLIAIAVAILLRFIFNRTVFGYELRASG